MYIQAVLKNARILLSRGSVKCDRNSSILFDLKQES